MKNLYFLLLFHSVPHIHRTRCWQIGGTIMLEILLGSPKEAKLIYSIFRSLCNDYESELKIVNQRCIKINPKIWEKSIERLIIPGLVQFIINHKEQQLMLTMIKEQYYFLEEEEQQQIIHIAQSIMEGEREDIPGVKQFPQRELILKEALEQFLRPDLYFSYTSFEKFRLHEYTTGLRSIVELAIEEYKLEQEYQNFIQSLRDYLVNRECVLDEIAIVHDTHFQVFNHFDEMTEDELKTYIDKKFVRQHPMYIDTNLLGPIVSIAPKKIKLFSDDPFDGMIQTILNVFEERVSIHSLSEFQN